nr:hypothetical protein [Halogeometricum sp. CBA1124]
MILGPGSDDGLITRGEKRWVVPADDYLDPRTALFVGGFVAFLFWFAGGLAYVAAGEVLPTVRTFALVFAGLGFVFLGGGAVVALVLRWRAGD